MVQLVGCWRDSPVRRWSGLFDCCRECSTTRPVPSVQTPCPDLAPGPCVQAPCPGPVFLVRGCRPAVGGYGAPAHRCPWAQIGLRAVEDRLMECTASC